MEKYLSIVENSQPKIEIEKDKLIFFISKVPIWEHFGITKISHLSSTVDEKKILLNKYYSELYTKYYGTGKNLIFCCLFFGLSLLFGFFLAADNYFLSMICRYKIIKNAFKS